MCVCVCAFMEKNFLCVCMCEEDMGVSVAILYRVLWQVLHIITVAHVYFNVSIAL